jgi:hypothetical protein
MVKTNNIRFNLEGSGVARDKHFGINQVDLPVFGDSTLDIPPFFMIKKKKGWKLVNPLTEMRTLATRKGGEKSIKINRKNVKNPELEVNTPQEIPVLAEFTKKDQATILKYFKSIQNGEQTEYQTKNKPRGFPATLYKNAQRAGLRETSKKVFTKNVKAPPKEKSGKPVGRPRRPKRRVVVVPDIPDPEEPDGSGLLSKLGKNIYDVVVKPKIEQAKKNIHRITHPKEALQEAKDFGRHLIYGRKDDYPPSVKKIIEDNQSFKVLDIDLHRAPIPKLYSLLMSWITSGEIDKRLAQEPKDTLFHISMWVKLSNGKTILVEKNEVINMIVNPKKKPEEEVQQISNPPPSLTFGDLLENTRKAVGDKKFFSYSAKNNNCGNFIEDILKTNGMKSQASHNFIGQDTKRIMRGFPSLNKIIDTITETAGKANVYLEGGSLEEKENILSHDNNIMTIQGGRMLPQHKGHPALTSDLFPRIPQAFTQIHLSHPTPISGSGIYRSIGRDSVKPMSGGELPPRSRGVITEPSLLGSGLGSGIKKHVKGSPEAKAWGEKMRELRMKKR